MVMVIFLTSLIVGELICAFLSYKWHIKIKIGLLSGIVFGAITGLILIIVHQQFTEMPFFLVFILENFLVTLFIITSIAFRFFRDPEREIPGEENIIVSPADGRVRYVIEFEKGEVPFSLKGKRSMSLSEMVETDFLEEAGLLIGIEMNVLDVHVNRAPTGGKIIFQKHIDGKFLSLGKLEALTTNERVTTVIDSGKFKVGMVQIASRLVRRIVSYHNVDESVAMGQRIGMIKFGSQVDLIIPRLNEIKVRVRQNDDVRAGSTIICEHTEK